MHCHRTDYSIHLLDSTTGKHNLMDFPELSKKKTQQPKPRETEKKIFVDIEPNDNDILLGRGGKNNMHVRSSCDL